MTELSWVIAVVIAYSIPAGIICGIGWAEEELTMVALGLVWPSLVVMGVLFIPVALIALVSCLVIRKVRDRKSARPWKDDRLKRAETLAVINRMNRK